MLKSIQRQLYSYYKYYQKIQQKSFATFFDGGASNAVLCGSYFHWYICKGLVSFSPQHTFQQSALKFNRSTPIVDRLKTAFFNFGSRPYLIFTEHKDIYIYSKHSVNLKPITLK